MDFAEVRREMVEHQLQARGIKDERVLNAFLQVPRERFVPAALHESAYSDKPLPIEEGQTISQPYILAFMIELLEIRPHHKVLEIGAGSGYAAAVLGHLAKRVYAVELRERLALKAAKRIEELGLDTVSIICADGSMGWPNYAPYDSILVSASAEAVPERLKWQLAVDGRLVVPVGEAYQGQDLVCVVRKNEGRFESFTVGEVSFLPLIERAEHPLHP